MVRFRARESKVFDKNGATLDNKMLIVLFYL